MALERRNHPRFPFSSRLEVRVARPTESVAVEEETEDVPVPFLVGTAVDVSVGGFCFRSPHPLSVGDLIAVTLPDVSQPTDSRGALAENGDLSILAVVRRVATRETAGEYLIGAERHPDFALA